MGEIEIAHLSKVYPNGFRAVNEIDLSVADGEFMVLVGPSGCGKTTLLRMVAGLEDISSGALRIDGKVVNALGPKERDVAMVFQNYALYPHMTVADNIGFSLRLRKHPKNEIDRKVKEAAAILGLSEWLDRKPGQLSGGQRQRVAMGRAIVREPAIFLMDEPLSNLDAKLRVQMRAEVSRVQRRLGVATVYVTHDQTEAMTMGDRVAVMREGSLHQCDDPQTLYDRPANIFVGSFIGSPAMNLFEAALEEGGEGVWLGSQRLPLTDQLRMRRPGLAAHANDKVVMGLRPEHLSAVGDDGAAQIYGDVDLVEALGSELLVHFTTDAKLVLGEGGGQQEAELSGRSAIVARVDPRSRMKPGSRVRFAVDIDKAQFFSRETGEAIWN